MAVLQAAAAVSQAPQRCVAGCYAVSQTLCRAPGCRVANVWPCREALPSWPGSPCHDTINCIVAFTPCLASFLLQYNSLPNGSLVTIHHSILRYKKKKPAASLSLCHNTTPSVTIQFQPPPGQTSLGVTIQ